jgi:hypothetical protein
VGAYAFVNNDLTYSDWHKAMQSREYNNPVVACGHEECSPIVLKPAKFGKVVDNGVNNSGFNLCGMELMFAIMMMN